MKYLACLFFVSAVSAGVMTDYTGSISAAASRSVSNVGSIGSVQSGGNYGTTTRQETRCTPYFDTVNREQCESYTERTCTTTQRESCADVADQNCNAVVSSKQLRKCFNVTEQRCSLKEDVQFDTIQVPIVVQKCQRVNERICDTVYETSTRTAEETACIDVQNPDCRNREETVFDKTCRTTTQFDCDTSYPDQYATSAGGVSGSGSSGAGAYDQGYGAQGGSGSAGSSDYGSTVNAYGQARANCRRSQDTKCYKTPRSVSVQECGRKTERKCERVSENQPFVSARQSCRNEEKKVCDLEERSQPKQVKKYVYSRQCSAVPRTICENADEKTLVPSCVGTSRKQCSYSPVEACEDTPKEHCFTVSQKIRKQRCETVTVNTGYAGSGSSGSVSGGFDSGVTTSDY